MKKDKKEKLADAVFRQFCKFWDTIRDLARENTKISKDTVDFIEFLSNLFNFSVATFQSCLESLLAEIDNAEKTGFLDEEQGEELKKAIKEFQDSWMKIINDHYSKRQENKTYISLIKK